MEGLNLVRNREIRLVPGIQIFPTYEELMVHHLKRKVISDPLPPSIIPEFDVGSRDPWALAGLGDLNEALYFFSLREVRPYIVTTSGYWKPNESDEQIKDSRSTAVIGMKKTLHFYMGKPPNGPRTLWVMHEYSLAGPTNPTQNWVVSRIFMKRTSTEDDGEVVL